MKKLIAILVALAMAAMLSITAFAAGEEEEVPTATAANAKLVKYLKMPSGVTVPDATFEFTFDAITEDAPAVTGVTLPAAQLTNPTEADDEGGVYGYKTIAQIFQGKTFPHAGIYEYVVTEVEGNVTDMVYDTTDAYTLRLYVNADGEITDVVVINGDITEEPEEPAPGEDPAEPTEPTKEDPGISDPTEPTGEEVDPGDEGKGFTFVNEYTAESIIRDDENPALELTKQVAGDYGSTDAEFKFSVTVTNASYTGDPTIAATEAGTATTITLGEAKTVTLKAGQKFVVENLPAGTTYSITENLTTSGVENAANYQATATTTGIAASAPTVAKGANIVVTSTASMADNGVANTVTITNTADELPPEGILISNLPYIALALVAIGGLVAYVVVRRKADDEA